MPSTGKLIAIAITGLFLTVLTTGIITAAPQILPNGGTVTTGGTVALAAINVGVYNDQACTQNCTQLNWGTLSPGDEMNKTVYVKNHGNVPATLNMTIADWIPANAESYLNLTWNRTGHKLSAGSSTPAVLTLKVSPDVANITSFSFHIYISGKD